MSTNTHLVPSFEVGKTAAEASLFMFTAEEEGKKSMAMAMQRFGWPPTVAQTVKLRNDCSGIPPVISLP